MPDDLIQPKTPAPEATVVEPTTPAPEAAAPAPEADSQASGLSEDLLRLPAVNALMAGSPAAVSGGLEEFKQRPEAKIIAANKDEMLKAGFFFYRSQDGNFGVLGNGLYISPDAVKQADAAGKLQEVAPSFDTVSQAVATSGDKHPVLAHGGNVPQGMAGAPAPNIPQMASGPTMPASTQNKLQTARLKNSQPGSPTSGPSPGAGRLANSIMKSPV